MPSRHTLLRLGALALIFVVAGTFSLMHQPAAIAGTDPYLGEIMMFGGNFAVRGWALCDGQLLNISSNTALFSILGTTYGGDGRSTFGLPDMRGRVPVHAGNGSGLTTRSLGAEFGSETHTLSVNQMPVHSHTPGVTSSAILQADGSDNDTATEKNPAGNTLGYGREKIYSTGTAATAMGASSIDLSVGVSIGDTGGGQSFDLSQPSLVVNFMIAVSGTFPSRN